MGLQDKVHALRRIFVPLHENRKAFHEINESVELGRVSYFLFDTFLYVQNLNALCSLGNDLVNLPEVDKNVFHSVFKGLERNLGY